VQRLLFGKVLLLAEMPNPGNYKAPLPKEGCLPVITWPTPSGVRPISPAWVYYKYSESPVVYQEFKVEFLYSFHALPPGEAKKYHQLQIQIPENYDPPNLSTEHISLERAFDRPRVSFSFVPESEHLPQELIFMIPALQHQYVAIPLRLTEARLVDRVFWYMKKAWTWVVTVLLGTALSMFFDLVKFKETWSKLFGKAKKTDIGTASSDGEGQE
jgi:hypothetical protein